MRNIEIMLSDGMIGQKSLALALSAFATGNLNAKIQKGAQHFTMKDIIPAMIDYITPPLTEEEKKAQVNEKLLAFMISAPNAHKFMVKADE